MTRTKQRFLGLLFLMLFAHGALAITLQEAKEQGLVGEQRDGYVGLVQGNSASEVTALVQQVNDERRRRYEQIARDNGLTMAQVTAVAYERAVEATQAGHYIQLPNGQWVRK
ncbi:MAG: YdbL family protein [Gammaproteobacteria bacterium]|nr:YdbL family protein [Pseudomonadales bacterium]MCP5347157.1 YdbL family protein [Pseudomonadales bacterium]